MTITVYEGTIKHELPFKDGETVLSVLQNAGIRSDLRSSFGRGAGRTSQDKGGR